MNTLPVQPDPSSQPGRASRLVAAVLPVARPRPAPGPAGQARREMPGNGAVDQPRREALMARHLAGAGADSPSGGGRAQRALAHYDAVAAIEQRQRLEETLRFSVWA